MPQAAIPFVAPIAGGLIGKAIGGGGPSNAQPVLPKDLQPMRQQNIGLLQYLLGFNQPGMPWSQPQPSQGPQSSGQGPTLNGGQAQNPANPGAGSSWGNWNNPANGLSRTPTQGAAPQGGGFQQFVQNGYGDLLNKGGQPPASQGGPMQRNGIAPNFSAGAAPQGLPSWADPRAVAANSQGWAAQQQGAQGTPFAPQYQPVPGGIATEGPGMMGQMGVPSWQNPSSGNPGMGFQTGGGTPAMGGQAQGNDPLGRIESYFGQLGTPTTPLQQQSLGGISQFLNSNPYGQSNQALQGIMGGQGFGESNQAFRGVGNANYFGGAQQGFQNVGNANLFGGAQDAFGQLGQSNNYQGASDIFSQLNSFNPFGAAQGSLEGQLATNPGQGMLDALRPQFERNLAQANQTGGRFGSSNAILNSRAVDDYNLLGAQALQQGVSQQQNAAGILAQIGQALGGFKQGAGQGMLGVGQGQSQNQTNAAQGMLGVGQGRLSQGLGSAQGLLGVGQGQLQQGLGAAQGLAGNAANQGSLALNAAGQMANNQNAMFNNYQGAYQTGSQQAQQQAQRQQQMLSILQNLLGASFGATIGAPSQVNPTGAQEGAAVGGGIGQLIAAMGQGGGGQGNIWGPASQYRL